MRVVDNIVLRVPGKNTLSMQDHYIVEAIQFDPIMTLLLFAF